MQVTTVPGLTAFIILVVFFILCILILVACAYRGCKAGEKFSRLLARRGADRSVEIDLADNIPVDRTTQLETSSSSVDSSSESVDLSVSDSQ